MIDQRLDLLTDWLSYFFDDENFVITSASDAWLSACRKVVLPKSSSSRKPCAKSEVIILFILHHYGRVKFLNVLNSYVCYHNLTMGH
jgi:hypothetical protein